MSARPLRIGVLALQGAFREHRNALEACGAEVLEIRRPFDDADDKYKRIQKARGGYGEYRWRYRTLESARY